MNLYVVYNSIASLNRHTSNISICDPSGEKGPSGGLCHNVRNDVMNVGNFPGTTEKHVVIFDDFQMRSIAL